MERRLFRLILLVLAALCFGNSTRFALSAGSGEVAEVAGAQIEGQGFGSWIVIFAKSELEVPVERSQFNVGIINQPATYTVLVCDMLQNISYDVYLDNSKLPGSHTSSSAGILKFEVSLTGQHIITVGMEPSIVTTGAGDVDKDGDVDILDITIISLAWGLRTGQTGYDTRADLNNDGVIDIMDATIVSLNWGNIYGSPAPILALFDSEPIPVETKAVLEYDAQKTPTINVTIELEANVEDCTAFAFEVRSPPTELKLSAVSPLVDAKILPLTRSDRVVCFFMLENLQTGVVPIAKISGRDFFLLPESDVELINIQWLDKENQVHTSLGLKKTIVRPLPEYFNFGENFPNPCNSETWIPYDLKEGTNVVIRIHDGIGRLVRTLNLGYQEPGFYDSKGRAAHWDGKNDLGEPVASGVYFYVIEAGDIISRRKMTLIR